MDETVSSSGLYSWLLLTLGVVVAALAVHVGFEWVRQAQRHPPFNQSWRALLLASATLGTGLCASIVLLMATAGLDFAIGYLALAVLGLLLVAALGSAVIAVLMVREQRWWALVGGGILLGILATVLQAGWIRAAGFRPGTDWRLELVASALALMSAGCSAGLWLAFSPLMQNRRRRKIGIWGASGVIAVSLLAGQQLMLTAADLGTQVGSVYVDEVPGNILAMACGVVAPLALAYMTLDLTARRGQQRRRRRVRKP